MKKNNIYDALSGIDEKYLERSEDFQEIRSQFKRKRIHIAEKYISFAACLAFTVIVGLNIYDKNDIAQQSSMIGTSYKNEQHTVITEVSTDTSKKPEHTTILKEHKTENSVTVLNTGTSQTTVKAKETKVKETAAYIHTEPSKTHTCAVTKVPVKKPAHSETSDSQKTHSTAVTAVTVKTTARPPVSNIPATAVTMPNEEPAKTNIVIDPVYKVSIDKDLFTEIRDISSDVNWDDMKIYEKFDLIVFNDMNYLTDGTIIGADRVGGNIGKITISGFDPYKYKTYYSDAEVFRINDIPETESVAVRFKEHNGYYIYTIVDYFYD